MYKATFDNGTEVIGVNFISNVGSGYLDMMINTMIRRRTFLRENNTQKFLSRIFDSYGVYYEFCKPESNNKVYLKELRGI